jgi:hypothetical protein
MGDAKETSCPCQSTDQAEGISESKRHCAAAQGHAHELRNPGRSFTGRPVQAGRATAQGGEAREEKEPVKRRIEQARSPQSLLGRSASGLRQASFESMMTVPSATPAPPVIAIAPTAAAPVAVIVRAATEAPTVDVRVVRHVAGIVAAAEIAGARRCAVTTTAIINHLGGS